MSSKGGELHEIRVLNVCEKNGNTWDIDESGYNNPSCVVSKIFRFNCNHWTRHQCYEQICANLHEAWKVWRDVHNSEIENMITNNLLMSYEQRMKKSSSEFKSEQRLKICYVKDAGQKLLDEQNKELRKFCDYNNYSIIKIVRCDSRKSDKYSELFKILLMTGPLKKY